MNFWTEEKIKEALGAVKTHNFPENWSSNGLVIWHENFVPGNMILVRGQGETRGITSIGLEQVLPDCSAIMSTKPAEYYKYNKPIIEISGNSGNSIINLARYIRKFFTGKVIAITGSSGKSTTTKMLVDVFSSKYNINSNIYSKANTSWGISWNMSRFDINGDYWIIETSLGGGISKNSAIVKPDYAIVTNVAPVHLTGNMHCIEDIAEEKSRIFHSMREGQVAVIYKEMNCYDIVRSAAEYKGLKILTYGEAQDCDVRIVMGDENKFIIRGNEYTLCSVPVGRHILLDMAATLAVAAEEGFAIEDAIDVLRNFQNLSGRGEEFEYIFDDGKKITVVDESYNANPLSMDAAISAFGLKYPTRKKVVILGDMAECGDDSEKYHREISKSIDKIKPDKVILCGKDIMYLFEEIKDRYEVKQYADTDVLTCNLNSELNDGDCVLFKSSHSSNLYKIIDKLKADLH